MIDWSQMIPAQAAIDAELVRAREAARTALVSLIEATATRLTGTVPLVEMLSWAPKEAAARAWLAGGQEPEQTALLEGEAGVTGEAVPDLAARIIANADAYRAAIARLTGLRRKAEAGFAAATTPAEVEAVQAGVLAALAAAEG